MVARLWPASEACQIDYEQLRGLVLSGQPIEGHPALHFARRGLAGLITCRSSDPCFEALLIGARRPAWSPYEDPRVAVLTDAYALLLADGWRASSDGEGRV